MPQTALQIGLVSRVVEPDKLMEAALELAREIAKNGPIGVAQAKFAINYGSEASLGVALPLESKAYEVTIPTRIDWKRWRPLRRNVNPYSKGNNAFSPGDTLNLINNKIEEVITVI